MTEFVPEFIPTAVNPAANIDPETGLPFVHRHRVESRRWSYSGAFAYVLCRCGQAGRVQLSPLARYWEPKLVGHYFEDLEAVTEW